MANPLLFAASFLFLFQPANALPESKQKSERAIHVTGEAVVKVVPDRVILSMTVDSRAPTLIKAQNKNKGRTYRVRQQSTSVGPQLT